MSEDQIHNDAELNRFRFPIDKGLSEEEAALRLKVAMNFLRAVPYQNLITFKGISRARAISAAFDWADAVLEFMQTDPSGSESSHKVSGQS